MAWLSPKLLPGVVAAVALGLAGCGGDSEPGSDASQATTASPASTATTSSERPATVTVNGEARTVTLSKVDFAYCRRKTDVCAAIRGSRFDRLSPVGKRAVREARRRKAARERQQELERQRQEELQRQQQQQQQAPVPQPQPQEGTTTG